MLDSILTRPKSTEAEQGRPDDDIDPDLESGSSSMAPNEPLAGDDRESIGSGLPLDVTFEILKNRRRRLILKYLESETEPTPIGELAEHIAAIENDIDPRQLDSQQRKRVYIGLYQCHLPKMDDAGVVEYNQTRGLVELNDSAVPLYEYLEPQEEPQNGNEHRYLLFTSLFAAAFLVTRLSSVPPMTDFLVLGFCLGMLSLVVYDTRQSSDDQ